MMVSLDLVFSTLVIGGFLGWMLGFSTTNAADQYESVRGVSVEEESDVDSEDNTQTNSELSETLNDIKSTVNEINDHLKFICLEIKSPLVPNSEETLGCDNLHETTSRSSSSTSSSSSEDLSKSFSNPTIF